MSRHAISEQKTPNVLEVAISEEIKDSVPWHTESWRRKRVDQAIEYANPRDLEAVCALIARLQPLIPASTIDAARKVFSEAAQGKAFIIQGGDCAESFSELEMSDIAGHLDLLSRQAELLSEALDGKQIIQIGRIAGQYAKPRSSPMERLPSGESVHAFRGHNVNSEDPKFRQPDPNRLLMGYAYSAATLRTIAHIQEVQTREVSRKPQLSNGTRGLHAKQKAESFFFTSHEALHLPLESAVTHGRYNTSATFLWVGERTRHIDSAHLEYIRGLRNPIGIKIGPSTTPESLVALLDVLTDPNEEVGSLPGRVTIITRLGAGRVDTVLVPLILAVQSSGHVPVWLCDPCHANTESASSGLKTRRVWSILQELKETYAVHRRLHSYLGGVHLEQCGSLVTECLDSSRVHGVLELEQCYRTLCDPRLAADQALEVVRNFATFMKHA